MARIKDNPLLRKTTKQVYTKMSFVEKMALIIVLELLCIVVFLIIGNFN